MVSEYGDAAASPGCAEAEPLMEREELKRRVVERLGLSLLNHAGSGDAVDHAINEAVEACAQEAEGHVAPIPGREDRKPPCYFEQGHECAESIAGSIRGLKREP